MVQGPQGREGGALPRQLRGERLGGHRQHHHGLPGDVQHVPYREIFNLNLIVRESELFRSEVSSA